MPRLICFLFLLASLGAYSQQSALNIVEKAIAYKATNDPKRAIDVYQYTTYEKTVITDSIDSGAHNYFSEKVSDTYYSQSQGFVENVIGFQLAGFTKTQYQVLAVNLQSRSFYDDDFVIFNTRYAGILSKRGIKNYNYVLLSSQKDYYEIGFTPKKKKAIPGLSGTMLLDKESFAITYINIEIEDKLSIKLEQTYIKNNDLGLFVPVKRKLFLDNNESDRNLSFFGGKLSVGRLQSGEMAELAKNKYLYSESVFSDFSRQANTFEKNQFSIIAQENALEQSEEFWTRYRQDKPTQKDERSFNEIEKIVTAENIERRLGTINNFSVGYYSVKFFDFDLTYPIKFNNFEGLRLGIGGVTNSSFSKRFRLEGYTAYGFVDQQLKYGLGGGFLINPKKNLWASLTFNNDLEEVGGYGYLTDRRVYSLFEPRLVNITQFYKHITTRVNIEYRAAPKLLSELQIAHRRIEQTLPYRFVVNNQEFRDYDITEATLGVRWSPGSKFMKSPDGVSEIYDGYPKISGQISQSIDGAGGDFNFTKIGAKAFYKLERLNKTATEILIEGNVGFGDLPITHLFHAFPNAPTKETILQRFSVAGVNSFETMFFGEFFSDVLFTTQLKHHLAPFNFGKKFKPEMVLIQRFAIGDISNPQDHLDISFDSLDQGFTETGFEINKIFWGFGTSFTYRWGAYHLPNFEDNIALKFTFNLQL